MNGWVVVLLNNAQTESLIPTIRKHVKADLTSCRETKAQRRREMTWRIYITQTHKHTQVTRWVGIAHESEAALDAVTQQTEIDLGYFQKQIHCKYNLYNCHDCSLLTDWKRQSFSLELLLQYGHKLLPDFLFLYEANKTIKFQHCRFQSFSALPQAGNDRSNAK